MASDRQSRQAGSRPTTGGGERMTRATDDPAVNGRQFQAPIRNRYFYGKLLDSYHFERETGYLNRKRWLINRLVNGWGVVCGLDVVSAERHEHLFVQPGVAIDKAGREIIVPSPSRHVEIPSKVVEEAAETESADRHGWKKRRTTVHLVLCYHECLIEPTPAMTTECNGAERCEPGAVAERYRLEFRPGPAPRVPMACHEYDFPDVVSRRGIEYRLLAEWVTRACPEVPKDPCIPLANIRVWGEDRPGCGRDDIDIAVRPIVYSNDVLFLLLLSLLEEPEHRRTK
jgi:hypothetical protein